MKKKLFVGIALSSRTKGQLAKLSNTLSESIKGIKWESVDDFHLTLKFLGSTEVASHIICNTITQKITGHISGFVIKFGQINTFVDSHTTVFIDIPPSEELWRLYHMLNNGLEPIGFSREKRTFHPHVTLGRSRGAIYPEINKTTALIEPILVEHISVIEHKANLAGSKYQKLDDILLM